MTRPILDDAFIHPAIREHIDQHQRAIIHEVQKAAAAHAVLVVGMAMNPFCSKARKLLDEANAPHHYLEYGSYLGRWRERNGLKMWAGWPTFPMVFVRGVLVGGANDLQRLIASGELAQRLAQ
ncbi:MAG: glutaredoxin [Burkholderiaceae bacterium]